MNTFLNILWGLPMVIFILLVGLILLIATKGLCFFHGDRLGKNHGGKRVPMPGEVTPFQAVCTALAGTVGTGNIVGVSLAVSVGGPGAIFWMWISALAGMIIKYSEVTLAVAYQEVNSSGERVGGPMYYISKALRVKWPAVLFALFGGLAAFGIGASVQGNSLATGITGSFSAVPTWAVGTVATLLAALVLMGGIKRISRVAEILVPFMAALYIFGAIVVLVINGKEIPGAFVNIFRGAFSGTAATGGFTGATVALACRTGMARGLFTHEAGMGSAPIAHGCAATDHPARQGRWGMAEVFFDSMIMCTLTGLVIVTSGQWKTPSGAAGKGENLSAIAFDAAFYGGKYVVTLCLALFAFATIIAWYYYGEKCIEFLFPEKSFVLWIYKLLYIIFVYIGTVGPIGFIWQWADLLNGLMALPNLIALVLLAPEVRRITISPHTPQS